MTTGRLINKITFPYCAYLLLILSFMLVKSSLHAEDTEGESEPQETQDILSSTLAAGEIFSCSTDIFYHWKSEQRPRESETPDETAATEPDEPKDTPLEQKEFFTTLVERGKRGHQTRQTLERRLDKSKSDAIASCRENHSSASCEAKKIQALASKFQILDFEGKRALRKNITDSCKEQSGQCTRSSSSDIACEIFTSPDTPLAAEPKKDEETKGKK
jgi:hypothetical protein